MYVLKDYAPYFEQKEEWKRHLENVKFNVSAGLFTATIFICIAEMFIK